MKPIISVYTDGDTVLVSIENCPQDKVIELIKTKMFPKQDICIKNVQGLDPEAPNIDEVTRLYTNGQKPKTFLRENGYSGFVSLLTGIKDNAFPEGERVEVIKLCKEFYASKKGLRLDKLSAFPLSQLKKFLASSYTLNEDLENSFYDSEYDTVEEYLETVLENILRFEANKISEVIRSYCEG